VAWGALCVLFSFGCGDDDSGGDVAEDVDAADIEETADGADADADADADAEAEADVDLDVAEDGSGVCEREFWIWDLAVMPPVDRQICCSLRGEGVNEHVWVEDAQWNASVDDMGVAEIVRRWDVETPAGSVAPDQGIFQILTGIFGNPPDAFDADPAIYILLYGIPPYGSFEFDGYFRATDQTTDPTSNRHEMIHINSLAGRRVASTYMLGVMAHEFHHMLQWRYDETEESWLSESFAETAMLLTGYLSDAATANGWARNPTAPLIVDGVGNPVDYGAAFLFGAYLLDRLSAAGLADLVADPAHGTASVAAAAQRLEPDATFSDFFADFAMTVALDDETIGDGRYGFLTLDPATATGTPLAFPATLAELTVPAGGIKVANVPLDGAPHAALGIDIAAGAGGTVGVRVALVDGTVGTQVFPVTPGTHLTLDDVPATATALRIALATDATLPITVSVSAADE
jgi:hypothetical protein